MAQYDKILFGPVDVYLKAYSGSFTSPVDDNEVDWTGWTKLGFQTTNGLEYSYKPTFESARVLETTTEVKDALKDEKLMYKFSLQETDARTLSYALATGTYTAGVADTSPNTLALGNKASILYWSIGLAGEAVDGNDLVIVSPIVIAVGDFKLAFKNAFRDIDFELEARADASQPRGEQLIKIYELL